MKMLSITDKAKEGIKSETIESLSMLDQEQLEHFCKIENIKIRKQKDCVLLFKNYIEESEITSIGYLYNL